MRQKVLWNAALIALLGLPLGPARAHAQGVTTSTLTGQVTDTAGTPLSDVQVSVSNASTGAQVGTITRSDGRYLVVALRPGGPYRVEARRLGYAAAAIENVHLALGEARELDVVLRPVAVQLAGVEVTAQAGQNRGSGVATVVDQATIESAPTLNREIVDLARLVPQAFVSNEDDDGAAISIAGQNAEYNALFIDGVVNNDVFGLSAQGTNGGQTGAPPISFDALEQLQIALSPYDVTTSGFTGGAINAITRSGTNEFTGSLYYQLRNPSLAGKTPGPDDLFDAGTPRQKLPEFDNKRYGLRLGGPIIRDKLFLFVNGEWFRSETPRPFVVSEYRGNSGARLSEVRSILQEEVGYDAGDFGTKASSLDDNKLLGKLDWNISPNHRLSVRHSYSQSDNIDAFASGTSRINYANNSEVFPNTTNSTALEINSRFGTRFANRFLVGASFVRDDRNFQGAPFPFVQADDGSGRLFLGSEQFSTGNILNQDVFSITNTLSYFRGRHTFTVGTHNEFYDIANLFIRQNFGSYRYATVDDFLRSVCAAGTGSSAYCEALRAAGPVTPAEPVSFQRGYSLVDNVIGDASNAVGAFKAYQLGLYAQDDIQVNERLRITAGLRVDVPKITTKPRFASDVFTTTIPMIEAEGYDLEGATPGETPDAMPYFAPRLGFTYAFPGAEAPRIRGGLGIFTGRVPFVYPGAMYLNNGVTTGFVSRARTLPGGEPIPFRPDPSTGLDATDFGLPASPTGELDIFTADFRYPRVFRTSLGVDMQLPARFTATVEGQYTKSLDNIIVENVNLKRRNATLNGPDRRPIYFYGYNNTFNSIDVNQSVIDRRYGNGIYKVGSTSEGYAYDITGSVQREFFSRALTARAAYTFGDSYSLNDATSDQIVSTWRFNENVRGLNDLELARSDWSIGHRILGQLTYRREFFSHLGTTISAVYTGESGRPYSFIIGNNFGFTGEGSGTSPLLFVPANASDLRFRDFTSGGVTYTAAQQQAAFEQFIAGDEYLSGRRGGYAERNAARTPFEHVVDLKLAQEIFGRVAGRRHGLEVTLDIFNFTNLLNNEWGLRYDPGFRTVDLLRFERFVSATDLTPQYTFRFPSFSGGEGVRNMEEFWRDEILDFGSYGSRWLMQLGLRYTF
ncbi:MAG: TonB-dependent receptor [Gemmatimonadaceae bacterium]